MGRTLPSITQVFLQEQEAFARFRRALRRSDQLALDDLFAAARQHLAAAAYAAHALPFEILLLAMLLEEHKEVAAPARQDRGAGARSARWNITGWLLDLYSRPGAGRGAVAAGEDGSRRRLRQPFPVTFYAAGARRAPARSCGATCRRSPIPLKLSRERAPRPVRR